MVSVASQMVYFKEKVNFGRSPDDELFAVVQKYRPHLDTKFVLHTAPLGETSPAEHKRSYDYKLYGNSVNELSQKIQKRRPRSVSFKARIPLAKSKWNPTTAARPSSNEVDTQSTTTLNPVNQDLFRLATEKSQNPVSLAKNLLYEDSSVAVHKRR